MQQYHIYTGLKGLIIFELALVYANIHLYYPEKLYHIIYISINEKHGSLKAVINTNPSGRYMILRFFHGTTKNHESYGNLGEILTTLKTHLKKHDKSRGHK